MTSYDGWPETVPYSEFSRAESEVSRLKAILDAQGVPDVKLIGEFDDGDVGTSRVVELMARYNQVLQHALAYKKLFHDTQDAHIKALDEVAKRGNTIKVQRSIIGRLEKRLGIDDNL